jgi:hypothetical protein
MLGRGPFGDEVIMTDEGMRHLTGDGVAKPNKVFGEKSPSS